MLLTRVLTAVIGGPLFVVILYLGGWPWFALVGALALAGAAEYVRMMRGKPSEALGPLCYLGVAGLILAFRAEEPAALGLALAALAVGLPMAGVIFRPGTYNVLNAIGTTFGIVYVGWLLGYLIPLRSYGWEYPVITFGGIWATDIFAYFTGRAFGRHKLAPAVSPGKSWEGAVGGALGSVIAVYLLGGLAGLPAAHRVILGAAISVAGQIGDLAESSLKRYAGVKDSGRLIPGHGGVLDRFDSTMFAAPVVYYYLVFFLRARS